MIDKSQFKVNERDGEYTASFDVRGTIRVEIKASSLDEAKAKAAAMCEDEEFGLELDDVDQIDVGHVSKCPAMYLVTRDGRKTQASWLQDGDLPREPDERGF